jgi:hypothetical protein
MAFVTLALLAMPWSRWPLLIRPPSYFFWDLSIWEPDLLSTRLQNSRFSKSRWTLPFGIFPEILDRCHVSSLRWTILVVSRFCDLWPPVTQILCQFESSVFEIPMDSRSPPRSTDGQSRSFRDFATCEVKMLTFLFCFSMSESLKWVISRHVSSLLIGRSRSISGLPPWSVLISCPLDLWNPEVQNPDTNSSFGTFASVHEGLTLMHLLTDPTTVGFSN